MRRLASNHHTQRNDRVGLNGHRQLIADLREFPGSGNSNYMNIALRNAMLVKRLQGAPQELIDDPLVESRCRHGDPHPRAIETTTERGSSFWIGRHEEEFKESLGVKSSDRSEDRKMVGTARFELATP